MHRFLAVALISALAACRPAETPAPPPPPPAWTDAATHKERFVEANGVRLNVLDWGGTGPALILIHGYGDSPHVFDDIAPALTDRFHVVAYARRGHGKSSSAESYSNAALAGDLIAVMDSLGIAKASLAGWSMGGNEITAAAGMYPDRVERIVYLDGAYDWADPAVAAAFAKMPISIDPPAEARANFQAFVAWWMPSWWPGGDLGRVEAYLRDISGAQPDGSLHPVPDSANTSRAFAALLSEHRDYRKVKAPALAIYSDLFLPPPANDSIAAAKVADWERTYFVGFRKASQARIKKELANVEIVSVPGSHGNFLFVAKDSVTALMRRFLK